MLSKQEFEQEIRRQYKIKDPYLVDALWKRHGVEYDFDDPELREEVWREIDAEIPIYALGRRRERTERERKQITIQPPGGAYETARAKVVSEYVAKVASADIVTTRYRERVLDRTLTAQEAKRFLSSPVAASVSTGIGLRLKRRRISFLDYEIKEE